MSSRLPGSSRPSLPFRIPGPLRFLLIGLAVLVAILVLSPFTAVPNGHRGIKLTFGKANDAPLSEGLHLRIPIMQTVYKMPVMIERSETEVAAPGRHRAGRHAYHLARIYWIHGAAVLER